VIDEKQLTGAEIFGCVYFSVNGNAKRLLTSQVFEVDGQQL
jgi:hypothetical protein